MKLSNTAQYAINTMVAIANHKEDRLLNTKSISQKLDIPYKYLTKITPKLVDAKLIHSTRGREGGYTLAKKASDIHIVDILEAVNDSLDAQKCILKMGKCDINSKCAMHDVWKDSKKSIQTMFNKTTLEDIANSITL